MSDFAAFDPSWSGGGDGSGGGNPADPMGGGGGGFDQFGNPMDAGYGGQGGGEGGNMPNQPGYDPGSWNQYSDQGGYSPASQPVPPPPDPPSPPGSSGAGTQSGAGPSQAATLQNIVNTLFGSSANSPTLGNLAEQTKGLYDYAGSGIGQTGQPSGASWITPTSARGGNYYGWPGGNANPPPGQDPYGNSYTTQPGYQPSPMSPLPAYPSQPPQTPIRPQAPSVPTPRPDPRRGDQPTVASDDAGDTFPPGRQDAPNKEQPTFANIPPPGTTQPTPNVDVGTPVPNYNPLLNDPNNPAVDVTGRTADTGTIQVPAPGVPPVATTANAAEAGAQPPTPAQQAGEAPPSPPGNAAAVAGGPPGAAMPQQIDPSTGQPVPSPEPAVNPPAATTEQQPPAGDTDHPAAGEPPAATSPPQSAPAYGNNRGQMGGIFGLLQGLLNAFFPGLGDLVGGMGGQGGQGGQPWQGSPQMPAAAGPPPQPGSPQYGRNPAAYPSGWRPPADQPPNTPPETPPPATANQGPTRAGGNLATGPFANEAERAQGTAAKGIPPDTVMGPTGQGATAQAGVPPRGSYPALNTRTGGRAVNFAGVNTGLQDTMAAAASQFEKNNPGYKVVVNSGRRGGPDPHGRGNAVDMAIINPQGQRINNNSADATGKYGELARNALAAQRTLHPELNGKFMWGGYFNAQGGHGFADPRTGANSPDLMHFDVEGGRSYRTAMRDRYYSQYGGQQPRPTTASASASTPGRSTLSRIADPRGKENVIRTAARKYGVDENTAMRVAKSEGLRDFYGDSRRSGGAFQLFTGGGLGNQFQKETGLNPLDPKNEDATIDWAMQYASKHGWGSWYGARNTGIGNWQGIRRTVATQ